MTDRFGLKSKGEEGSEENEWRRRREGKGGTYKLGRRRERDLLSDGAKQM